MGSEMGGAASNPAVSGPLSARSLLRWQFRLAHRLLEATVHELPAEALHRRPPGAAAPAGASYAQVVLGEDLSVNGVLAGRPPLAFSAWAGRTGLSELPALVESGGEPDGWDAWAHRVQVDLAAFRAYAQAVYTA